MELDDEIKGSGSSLNFGQRIYDPRLGKFLSTDPMEQKYPMNSPYLGLGNSPITMIDPDGGENIVYLVFIQPKGKKAMSADDMKAIAEYTQQILTHNKINAKVIPLWTPTPARILKDRFDKSDVVVYLGAGEDLKDAGFNYNGHGDTQNLIGQTDPFSNQRTGSVNLTPTLKESNWRKPTSEAEEAKNDEIEKETGEFSNTLFWAARTALHEGLIHGIIGIGHPEDQFGVLRTRRITKPENRFVTSLATGGSSTPLHRYPLSNGHGKIMMFILPEHIDIIKNVLKDGVTPKDNLHKGDIIIDDVTPIAPGCEVICNPPPIGRDTNLNFNRLD